MNTRTPFTSDTLADIGRALYGDRWQTPLAQDLKVNDRSLRRWLNGEAPVPEAVEYEARALLEKRHQEMGGIIRYSVSPAQRMIFHYPTSSYYAYDENDNVSFAFGPSVPEDQKPLLTLGAAEALRMDQERQQRVKPQYVDLGRARQYGPAELAIDYNGCAIMYPTRRIDTARFLVNVASENPNLQARIGRSAAVFEGASLEEAVSKAQRYIDGLTTGGLFGN